jgi:GntR family transcriptional regulator, transcriptional repressor for pyruvate dehydrogenase complex
MPARVGTRLSDADGYRPIVRRKLYELVAERVLEDVSRGLLKPGDGLPTERGLAERYGVGRSTIREALRMLESAGTIESVGSGAFVVARSGNPINRSLAQSLALLVSTRDGDIRELFEVRKILEVETAGLAADRRTEEDIVGMKAALEEMRIGIGSRERYIAGDLRFHLAVVAASHNRMASHMMEAMRHVMRRALASIYEIPGSPQRSLEQHAQIFDAVVEGHCDEARDRMRGHLLAVEHDVGETLRTLTEGVPRERDHG